MKTRYISYRQLRSFICIFLCAGAMLSYGQDQTPPMAECLDVDTIFLDTPTQWLHASVLDGGSTDDSTASDHLRFAFSENVADSIREFSCHNTATQIMEMYVFDEAGNVDNCWRFPRLYFPNCLDSADVKPPSPVCRTGVSTTVYSQHEYITVPARIFDSSSFDDRTDNDKLLFSYSIDPADSLMTLAYTDTVASKVISVRVYVHDEAGNYEYCTTSIAVNFAHRTLADSVSHMGDTIPPVFYIGYVQSVYIGPSGYICFDVNDFIIEALDNETPVELLGLSFDSIYSLPQTCISCGMVPFGTEETFSITLSVKDEAGNTSINSVYVSIINVDADCDNVQDDEPPIVDCVSDTLQLYLTPFDSLNKYTISVSDNMASPEDLTYVNSRSTYSNVFSYSCSDTGFVQFFDLSVQDLNGNKTICRQYYEVLDTLNLCGNSGTDEPAEFGVDIMIYPIPAHDVVYVENKNPLDRIAVYSALGKLLISNAPQAGSQVHQVRVGGLAEGLYFVEVASRGERYMRQLLLVR